MGEGFAADEMQILVCFQNNLKRIQDLKKVKERRASFNWTINLLLGELNRDRMGVSREQLELSERKAVVDINVMHRIKSNLFKE